jgi:hypothetical protein
MGADNGGMVLNLSEGGLGFQSVGRVLPESQLAVSFSLGPGYRIDVKARVVWVNPAGKTGGAAFGKLSKDSLSLIREWLAKPELEHEVEHAVVVPEADAVPATAAQETAAIPSNGAVAQQVAANDDQGAVPGSSVIEPPLHVEMPPEPAPVASFPAHEVVPEVVARAVLPTPEPSFAAPVPPVQTRVAAEARETPPPPIRRAPPQPRASQNTGDRSSEEGFSVVPSIAAWSRNDAASSQRIPPPPRAKGPLFPPRSADNIFSRSPSRMQAESGRRGSGVLMILAIIIAVGAIFAFYGRSYRQEIGSAIVRLGDRVSGATVASATSTPPETNAPVSNAGNANATGAPPTDQNATPPASVPSSSGNAPGGAPTTQAGNATRPASIPAGNAVPQNTQPNGASGAAKTQTAQVYPGQAEYNRAEQYLNGKGVQQDPAEAAEWFWRSLEAGYTDAAIPLADLYLAGNGVSRSCTQARILLNAAAEKNIPEAIKKLDELPESCQ